VTMPARKMANSAEVDVRTELVSRIVAHAPTGGEHSTAIPGLILFRRTQATACYRAAVEPSLTVFVQGKKRMSLGGNPYLCGPGSFFLSSIDVPIESQIVEASEEVPLLSMLLRLDMTIVREILNREELPESEVSSQRRGVAVGQASVGLLKASSRLVELLDTPEDIPFLSHLIQREIIYRILRTPQGARLRTIATTGDLGNRTARAISWLRDLPKRSENQTGVRSPVCLRPRERIDCSEPKPRAGVQHSRYRHKAQEQGDSGSTGNRVEDCHGLAHDVADSGSTCCRHGNAD